MRQDQFEHVLRAAAAVTDEDHLVIVGSQALLGSGCDANLIPELLMSVEVDLYPRDRPDRAIDIDGSIGDGSIFHETFGYYGHGVGPETAVAPAGWRDRLVPYTSENTRGATGWCLDPHDLVLAKLVAGREKDIAFASAALAHNIVEREVLLERAGSLPVSEAVRQLVIAALVV